MIQNACNLRNDAWRNNKSSRRTQWNPLRREDSLPDCRNLGRSWNPKNLRNATTNILRWSIEKPLNSAASAKKRLPPRNLGENKNKLHCSWIRYSGFDCRKSFLFQARPRDWSNVLQYISRVYAMWTQIYLLSFHAYSQWERSWNEVRIISSVVFDAMPSANYFPPCNTRNTLCCEPDTASRFPAPFAIKIANAVDRFRASRCSKCLFTN